MRLIAPALPPPPPPFLLPSLSPGWADRIYSGRPTLLHTKSRTFFCSLSPRPSSCSAVWSSTFGFSMGGQTKYVSRVSFAQGKPVERERERRSVGY